MLLVDEALTRILDRITILPAEDVAIAHALARVLAANVTAHSNIPPFANSSMDGYAVYAADVASAASDSPARLPVSMEIRAGTVAEQPLTPGHAARIMTGAPLPPGANAVVPVEQTDDRWASDGDAPLPETVAVYRRVKPGDYVRPEGEDIHTGQTVLKAGAVLRPQDIGVLVSLGYAHIPVIRQPRVAVLATGDELVDAGEPLGPGKIRNSNSYILAALVTASGGVPLRLPIARDTVDEVRHAFESALALQPDLIVSSAGVSVGTHDVVRTVVNSLGQIDLWRVNLRPGKPLAFGQVQGAPFFGLPGNPVSSMVTFDIFVRPALLKQSGRDPNATQTIAAVLGEDLESDGRRSYLRVTLSREGKQWVARTTGTQSSGALMSMVLADGLLIVPEGVTFAPAGARFDVKLLRDLPLPH